jgi:hypothetical protein
MKMDFKKGFVIGFASLCLSFGTMTKVYSAEYRKEGWPVHDLIWYSSRDYYYEDGDGDGNKETVVEIYENIKGDRILRYKTEYSKGNRTWASDKISNPGKEDDGAVVDSQCTGIFDMKYKRGEKFTLPECLKSK